MFIEEGWEEIDGDWQTDRNWVRVLDVTNRQTGRARGGQRGLYSPGETGFILTYAQEWNEDWHDLLIWAVAAHDGHGYSPVTLYRAQRMSCHQDRSQIEIPPLIGGIQTKLLCQTHICRSTCLCCSCLATAALWIVIISYSCRHEFCLPFIYSDLFQAEASM